MKSVTKNGVSSNGFALMHIGVILFEEHDGRTDSRGQPFQDRLGLERGNSISR